MPKDKTASLARVLAAAREEFLEYGFEKASMRRVGVRCGLTAAGLYRHCRDKEDLFDQIVSPCVEAVRIWQEAHIARYEEALSGGSLPVWRDSWIDMMRDLVYPSMEDYSIVMLRFIVAWHRIRGDQKLYQVFGGMNMEYAALTGQNAVLYTSDQVQQIVSTLLAALSDQG